MEIRIQKLLQGLGICFVLFCFNSPGDCDLARTRAPTLGSWNPSKPQQPTWLSLREEANLSFPSSPIRNVGGGFRSWSSQNSGWRWAGNGPKHPLSPSLVSAFQAHPPGPLVTGRPHAYTQALTCPEPRSSTSQAAFSVCFEQRQLFSQECTAGRCLSIFSRSPHPSHLYSHL